MMRAKLSARAAIVLIACAAVACSKGPPGRKLASGIARDVMLSPSGDMVSFLTGVAHPDDPSLPEDLLLGDLDLARVDSGSASQIGSAVPNLRSARSYDPSGGSLAFLARYRFRDGNGELRVSDGPGAARTVAEGVTSFAWAPSGKMLAFVADGRLRALDLSREGAAPSVALDGVQSFAWAPAGTRLAARAAGAAGGRVELFDVATGRTREAAKSSSDLAFGPDGALYVLGAAPEKGGDRALWSVPSFDAPAQQVGRATSFAVSAQGDLALLSTEKNPGAAFGALLRRARTGRAEPVGERVSEFRFTTRGDLVFLAAYDLRARAGTLAVAPLVGPVRDLGQKVQSFSLVGDRVLYIVQHPEKGDFRIELWTTDLSSQAPPRKVDDGVYGYELAPDGLTLFYKARCAGGPRSCSLFREPVDGSRPAQVVAPEIAGFELSKDGKRILLAIPHRGAPRAVDLAVVSAEGAGGSPKPFVEEVDPAAVFADAKGKRAVYAALTSGRAGVYVVDLP
ncbi:MAG: TolB family protein, partial [Myxococcales bacterium]